MGSCSNELKLLRYVIMSVVAKRFSEQDKKYDAVIDGTKTVSFGAKGYSDYTKTKTLREKLATYSGIRLQKTGESRG